jgi:NAD(P)-dependent dehydrogenase (short-subunit alcohol dehydrogenase family)
MKIGIVGIDSDIGLQVYKQHLARGDQVVATSRNRIADTRPMELVNPGSWWMPDHTVQRIYYNIGVGDDRLSRQEVMNVNAFLTVDYLNAAARVAAPGTQIVVYTSEWGSIANVRNARALHYRMSKAALNMGVAALQRRYPRVNFMLLHPGLVRTKMLKGEFDVPVLTPVESATQTLALLDAWDGVFGYWAADGRKLEW